MNKFQQTLRVNDSDKILKEASQYERLNSPFINAEQKRRRNSRTTVHISIEDHVRLKLMAMELSKRGIYPGQKTSGMVTMNDVLEAALIRYLDYLESELGKNSDDDNS